VGAGWKARQHYSDKRRGLVFPPALHHQVPSNLVMVRVGFRPWLAFLLVSWGVVAACFMFISRPWSFYLLRLLLGMLESGAFPAMWYALSTFYPRRR
jgi:MFS family permease